MLIGTLLTKSWADALNWQCQFGVNPSGDTIFTDYANEISSAINHNIRRNNMPIRHTFIISDPLKRRNFDVTAQWSTFIAAFALRTKCAKVQGINDDTRTILSIKRLCFIPCFSGRRECLQNTFSYSSYSGDCAPKFFTRNRSHYLVIAGNWE